MGGAGQSPAFEEEVEGRRERRGGGWEGMGGEPASHHQVKGGPLWMRSCWRSCDSG